MIHMSKEDFHHFSVKWESVCCLLKSCKKNLTEIEITSSDKADSRSSEKGFS